jgi:isopenicillin N synthase-like dioxygenase
MASTARLPVIDVSAALAGDPEARSGVATAIDSACVDSGFFAIAGHGIESALLDDVIDTSRRFFALDPAEKGRVAPPGPLDYRGFLGLDTTSLAATLGEETPPDLCESYNIGGFDDPEKRARATVPGHEMTFLHNLWPERPDGFRAAYEAYFEAVEHLCRQMLPLFALALGLPESWFEDKVNDHTSLLLTNWYPPVQSDPRPGQLRRGGHTDYGMFTVVAPEQVPGLQICLDGTWLDVPLVEDAFVVNLGDLMGRWTNDRWVSTLHRVVVPEGDAARRDRMSVVFFFQPDFRAVIETIPTTVTDEHPARYEPVIAGEWIAAKSMSMLDE